MAIYRIILVIKLPYETPKKILYRVQFQVNYLEKSFPYLLFDAANPLMKMAINQMKTMYLIHLHLKNNIILFFYLKDGAIQSI